MLRVFLRLGLTSFGGPIAHLGYFHREFVEQRGWLDEHRYAQLIGISQFLPGPASSQLGFAIGLLRAGVPGALAAFVGFTLPSALLLFAFAAIAPQLRTGLGAAAIHGLELVAGCVVAYGLVGMARRLTPDLPRIVIAIGALLLMLVLQRASAQLVAIAAGGLLGAAFVRSSAHRSSLVLPVRYGLRSGIVLLAVFAVLLAAALLFAPAEPSLAAVGAAFYRAGALVFGGGHVVLPLLQEAVVAPGWIDADTFLAGYGAAQAVPGPMFSVAAFLGAHAASGPAWSGALVALVAIFVPGFLLLLAILPGWSALTRWPGIAAAIGGVNAAVVGLLAAAFYDPILTHGIESIIDVGIVVVGFALLAVLRAN
ncbi:MAG TPA: chromate efflux transporter, partial [Steroidobacteraceae bacterium]|nr:chromate efflux transporter [Steroidobacteraceae bacterium]